MGAYLYVSTILFQSDTQGFNMVLGIQACLNGEKYFQLSGGVEMVHTLSS